MGITCKKDTGKMKSIMLEAKKAGDRLASFAKKEPKTLKVSTSSQK